MIYRSYYLWKFEASSLFWFLSCWRIVSDFLNSCFLWSMWFLNLWISTSSNSWVFGMLIEVFWCLIHKCEKCYFEGLTWILQSGWKTLSDLCSFWKNSRSLNECYQFVIASPQVPSMNQSMMNTNSSTLSLHVSLSIWSQHFEDWINFQVRQACWLEQCWQRWIMNKLLTYMSIRMLMLQCNWHILAKLFKISKLSQAESQSLHEVIMRLTRVIIPNSNNQFSPLNVLDIHLQLNPRIVEDLMIWMATLKKKSCLNSGLMFLSKVCVLLFSIWNVDIPVASSRR